MKLRKICFVMGIALNIALLAGCANKDTGNDLPQVTLTPVPADTPVPTATSIPTDTPVPTATCTPTATNTPTNTPIPTASPFSYTRNERETENLGRGLVALSCNDGVYLSWRLLGTDPLDLAFNLYRNGELVNETPIDGATNYVDTKGKAGDTYTVVALADKAQLTSANITTGYKWQDGVTTVTEKTEIDLYVTDVALSDTCIASATNYIDVPVNIPEKFVHTYITKVTESTYFPNDVSVGDLDGDGEYEIVLKWDPSNSHDNAHNGVTGVVYFDAYKLDGTHMWRINMGMNIRAGAHYTQFMVYDFDSDGKAEIIMKTGDGTIDGKGNVIGDGSKIYMSGTDGRITWGPEYLTLFDGETGEALDTIDYQPERGKIGWWGDDYANRSERYLAAVAYLDGNTPSCIMSRGYYARTAIAAYNVSDKKLSMIWKFDTRDDKALAIYEGQGNHNLAVADVDGDGYDEIVFGSLTMDQDGTVLSCTGQGHGDAMHVGDLVLSNPGVEAWGCYEGSHGAGLWNPNEGTLLIRQSDDGDTGRGVTGNFVAGNDCYEFVSARSYDVYDKDENVVGTWPKKSSMNYAIYWDADLEHEISDGNNVLALDGTVLLSGEGTTSINGTKRNSSLTADVLGDWREEIIVPTLDGTALRIFITTDVTDVRLFTLMHDTQYRCQVASQNVAYNQGALTSFFLGTGYELPERPYICPVGYEK